MEYPFEDKLEKKTYKGSSNLIPGKLYRLVSAPNNCDSVSWPIGKIYMCVIGYRNGVYDKICVVDGNFRATHVSNPNYIFEDYHE